MVTFLWCILETSLSPVKIYSVETIKLLEKGYHKVNYISFWSRFRSVWLWACFFSTPYVT